MQIHIHCFTDSPAFAQRLLDWFPNLYIGITGVITYATNRDTSAVIRNMVSSPSPSPGNPDANLRILLETDAPYMIPSNLYASITSLADVPGLKKGAKLPVCHSAMLPWTAEFVAGVANEAELALTSETRASISSEAQGVVENGGADALVANEAKAEREGEGEEKAVTWTADRVMRIARQNAQFIYGV
ncbi:hypothetical protein DXG03_007600 [Asterophora parasitica]|uniref:Uncharacterized protein n=1 Tax=Asterophora parasitica TaxID=117018 RepID=A0A9P7K839_9AGAR|nr:hypothetical protein DXG03_007600 [Asterophora parasitica]